MQVLSTFTLLSSVLLYIQGSLKGTERRMAWELRPCLGEHCLGPSHMHQLTTTRKPARFWSTEVIGLPSAFKIAVFIFLLKLNPSKITELTTAGPNWLQAQRSLSFGVRSRNVKSKYIYLHIFCES